MASELHKRVLSALVLIPPVAAAVYFGAPYFDALVVLCAALMIWEWFDMAQAEPPWLIGGGAYILIACFFLHDLRLGGEAGLWTMTFLLAVIWATDTGAYLIGRALGGPKLAPRISPSKTMSGAIGGLLSGVAAGMVVTLAWGLEVGFFVIILAALASIAGQAGDLIESQAKRHFKIKDSGRMIPGHGGILDRVDGLLAGAVAMGMVKMTIGLEMAT